MHDTGDDACTMELRFQLTGSLVEVNSSRWHLLIINYVKCGFHMFKASKNTGNPAV